MTLKCLCLSSLSSMFSRTKLLIFLLILAGCTPHVTTIPPSTPNPIIPPAPKVIQVSLFEPPEVPALSPAGENLVIEFEVGGRSDYNPRPEAPDCRYSGWTTGIGYDWSQNDPKTAVSDWQGSIGETPAKRLAAGHSFRGCVAQAHLHEVRDILTPWQSAVGVFDKIDVAREWSRAERALPGFDTLRPNAQAALISLGFNRGWSMTGDSRREMRGIKAAVAQGDYAEIAKQLRIMPRVWAGTEIYHGMYRRRMAEADLVLKP